MRRTSLVTLSIGLLLACSEPPRAGLTEPEAMPPTARVLRTTDIISDFMVDEDAGLSILIGFTYEGIVEVCSTGEPNFDLGTLLLVERPDGSLKLQLTGKDVSVVVFEGILGPTCGSFLSATPLATGTVNFTRSDNDFFVSGERTNSFHQLLTGSGVYTGTDEPVHIMVKFFGTIHKDFSGQISLEIRLN